MPRLLINLDVDDIERAVTFYTEGLGLSVGRRFDSGFVELVGAEAPIYLLDKAAGTAPFPGAGAPREYRRHWTPLHLDFVVPNIEQAVDELTAKGIQMERYDMPQMNQDARGIARDDFGPAIAWFKDPAGNILAVLEAR